METGRCEPAPAGLRDDFGTGVEFQQSGLVKVNPMQTQIEITAGASTTPLPTSIRSKVMQASDDELKIFPFSIVQNAR